jgi:putative sigma-54 modulation protein
VQLDITPRNYQPTRRVRDTVEERAERFQRFAEVDRVRVTLTAEHVEQICEIHVHVLGKDFHSKASSEDMLSSVDKATATLEKQLRRYKTKRDDARKKGRSEHPGVTSAAALEASLQDEQGVPEESEEEL